jgi:mannose-6-phosphate isomerase-like protein (cupin superfamily)
MLRLAYVCLPILLAPAALAQTEALRALQPDEIQWSQRRQSPDVFYAGIYGDPAKAGPYAFRVRAQAGHSLPPHTHPDERTVTVLSGTYWSGVGESYDESRLVAFPAGSFYVIPAGVPHFSAVLSGEVVFQEGGVGPSSHDLVRK